MLTDNGLLTLRMNGDHPLSIIVFSLYRHLLP